MIVGLFQRALQPLMHNIRHSLGATSGGGLGSGWRPLLHPLLLPMRTFKVRTSVRLRCDSCYFARRGGTLFVRCKTHPRHKQRQGRATRKQQVF